MNSPKLRNGRPPPPRLQPDRCHQGAGEAEVVAKEDAAHQAIVAGQGGHDELNMVTTKTSQR
jgi:hypothetical protein